MKNEDLIELGFKEVPHYTVGNSVTYHLGRNKYLSGSCIGTPNEMLFIYETNSDDDKDITDIISLHNYDYDGYLTKQRLKLLMKALTLK